MSTFSKKVVNPEAGKGWDVLAGSGVSQLIHSDGVIIELPGVRLAYVSGKTATNEHGELVGRGDIKVQTRQVLSNIQRILGEAGGTIDDIVRVRVFVRKPLSREDFGRIHEARAEFFRKPNYPASTLVVVEALVRDGALIEIDADAVIPIRQSG